jgi:type VII secretion-associated serine protease mycosin
LLAFVMPTAPARADEVRTAEWQLRYLDITRVHGISQGENITVGLIDAGVNGNHPDLVGNVLPGFSLLPNYPGNGWEDIGTHGTAMAGLIAGHGHDGDGVLGLAPKSKILPLQVGSGDKASDADAIAAAIDTAVEHGARVISLSLGVGSSSLLRSAVERAEQADTVLVAAAGNRPEDNTVNWPARYDGVVAVGAVDQNGNLASFSVTGPQVLVSAPGVDVETTNTHNGYARVSGTSPATAITAGVVALIRSKYPTMSAKDVIHRLTATATDRGAPGRDDEYGYGIVNPYAALTADVPSTSASASPAQSPTAPSPSSTGQAPQHPSNRTAGLAVTVVLIALAVGAAIWIRRTAARYRRTIT